MNTATDIALFAALTNVAGVAPAPANVTSYSTGILISFVLNRTWTFRTLDRAVVGPFIRFVVVALGALMLSTLLVTALAHYMPALLAKGLSIPATFVWGFILNRQFVFPARGR